jgi:hypothetical protein
MNSKITAFPANMCNSRKATRQCAKSIKAAKNIRERTQNRTPTGLNRTKNADFRAFSRARLWC